MSAALYFSLSSLDQPRHFGRGPLPSSVDDEDEWDVVESDDEDSSDVKPSPFVKKQKELSDTESDHGAQVEMPPVEIEEVTGGKPKFIKRVHILEADYTKLISDEVDKLCLT